MGRPSKLTPAQWDEVQRRLLAGETASALAREFGVVESAIRKRFGAARDVSAKSAKVKNVALKLAEASAALEALPPTQRHVAISLAEAMREVSTNLAQAARLSSDTAARLSSIANAQAQLIDQQDPQAEYVQRVAVITRTANDAAVLPTNLLKINEGAAKQAEQGEAAEFLRTLQPKLIGVTQAVPADDDED